MAPDKKFLPIARTLKSQPLMNPPGQSDEFPLIIYIMWSQASKCWIRELKIQENFEEVG